MSVTRPGERLGRSSSNASRKAATPAGLWAPSRSTSGVSTANVSVVAGHARPSAARLRSSRRPGQRAAARPSSVVAAGDVDDARPAQGVEDADRDRRVARLVATEQAQTHVAQAIEAEPQAATVHAQDGRRRHLGQRSVDPCRAAPDGRQPIAAGARDRAVATLDDGRLLAADGRQAGPEVLHVVEGHVGHRRHPAVPGIGRIEAAAETDLDHGHVDGRSGEGQEGGCGQDLELGRRPQPTGHDIARRQGGAQDVGEVVGRHEADRR